MPELICIVCPRGCRLNVDQDLNVTGNFCKRGIIYGKSEVTNPTRTVTSTVKIDSKITTRLSVITSKPIPKEKIFEVMDLINQVVVKPPIKVRDVIIPNILNLGIDIVATRNIEE